MHGNVTIDFSKITGKVNPRLYCSGWHTNISSRHIHDYYEAFKELSFTEVRNHDWSLNNPNQRMIDIHHIFPLMHLDADDERNYYFGPSDEAIRLCYEAGTSVFYRLGTSIEHTEGVHFNANPPEDFEKYADVCAHVIRHYTQGWNKGFHYDMKYWEIWNEPEGVRNMWTGTQEQYVKFYIIMLRRLKSEFPELKIGGPALCNFNTEWLDALKAGCDAAGLKPDFFSFHMYGNSPERPNRDLPFAKEYMKKIGWGDVELCLNEWHFIRSWAGVHSNLTEASYRRNMDSSDGLLNNNSAAFNIAVFALLHQYEIDSAYYYGCGFSGSWGFTRPSGAWNKNYYSMLMMRDVVKGYAKRVEAVSDDAMLTPLAAISADGQKGIVLLSDFCGNGMNVKCSLQGLGDFKVTECKMIDEYNDWADVEWLVDEAGLYTLPKNMPGSAVFMLKVESNS